jgi:hypothetical protein
MNKYSKKILNFIIKNTDIKHTNIIKSKLINDIITISKNILNSDINLQYDILYLNKIHSDEYPLLYKFFNLYYEKSNHDLPYDKDNFVEFLKFYSNEQHKINFKDMIKSSKSNETNKIINKIYDETTKRYELHKSLYDNNFVGLDVLFELETNDVGFIEINAYKINLKLYWPKQFYTEELIKNKLISIIKIIKLIQQINIEYFEANIDFNVCIYLSKLKKILPTRNEYITPINMNSGSSMRGVIVNIWRDEELEKVLIHELCHYINADFFYDVDGYDKLNDDLNKIFDIDGKNNPNETYNETLAGIINICFQSIKYNLSFEDILFYETEFLFIQTAKIILFLKGSKYRQLFKSNPNHLVISQTTSVLSYIILKMIMFFNINASIEFIEKCNIKCNSPEKINEFNLFLMKLLNDKSIQSSIENRVNFWIKKINNLDDSFIKSNLRMCVID